VLLTFLRIPEANSRIDFEIASSSGYIFWKVLSGRTQGGSVFRPTTIQSKRIVRVFEDTSIGPLLGLGSEVFVPSQGFRAVLGTHDVVRGEICLYIAIGGTPDCRAGKCGQEGGRKEGEREKETNGRHSKGEWVERKVERDGGISSSSVGL